ncbi:FxsA family protein [Neisseria sp. Ec49-e6-T10]|uniref:FxsA family protein n=1 Tax=Neisseria sp. Ec49-e6-T10 TaxID=3140744 RepID=UPI003EC060C3
MRYFAISFWLYFILEICSIIFVADAIGAFWTMIWFIASFLLGLFMLRNVGLSKIFVLGSLWKNNTLSFYQAMWPIRYTLAAILFMIPGFVSDLLALLLILPFKGPKATQQNFTFTSAQGGFKTYQNSNEDIIEGEVTEVAPDPIDPNKALPKD